MAPWSHHSNVRLINGPGHPWIHCKKVSVIIINEDIYSCSNKGVVLAGEKQVKPFINYYFPQTNTQPMNYIIHIIGQKTIQILFYLGLPLLCIYLSSRNFWQEKYWIWHYSDFAPDNQTEASGFCTRHFSNTFTLKDNMCILIAISLKRASSSSISYTSVQCEVITWCQIGNKPIHELTITQINCAMRRY